MNFEYSTEWENEIVHLTDLAHLGTASIKQYERLENLIEIAEHTKDKKIVRVLMKCLAFYRASIDSTFEGVLSTIDYSLFYSTLFELVPELLQKGYGHFIINFFIVNEDHEDTEEEWQIIESIAKSHLNKNDIKGILEAYQAQAEVAYSSYPDDYPYDVFEKIFKKILKEKSE